MRCRLCTSPLAYIHGHAACLNNRCPFFGMNQSECCAGETAETCPAIADPGPTAAPPARSPVLPAR